MSSRILSLQDFEVGSLIGEGALAKVYQARIVPTNEKRALKLMSKRVIIKKNLEPFLYREIKIHAMLRHPNILRLYDFFWNDQNVYLVLELAPQGDLYTRLVLQEHSRFSPKRAAKVKSVFCVIFLTNVSFSKQFMRQICDALDYCHKEGVIHCDIKAENLLLDVNGNIKLADFGLSVHSPPERQQTICGTPAYLAPEILAKKKYDHRVDIWACGVLAYELLVGVTPLERGSLDFTEHVDAMARDYITKFLRVKPRLRMTLEESLRHEWIVQNCRGS